MYQSLVEQTTD